MQLNEKFGDYTLLEQVGIGGMAEVYLARRTGMAGFEKDIVIKRIRPHLTEQRAFVNMFLGEAKLAAQLIHPNIVHIYDLGRIEDSYFIAMEYVAGQDMSAIIPKIKERGIHLPVEYALKIGSSVCEALNYAHNQNDTQGKPLQIVHRDVSPENIRIAWTGTVKILDFGIAKAATQMHETKAGEIKGKLCYMSPEQVLGKDVDRRSDIFALGCVLYEALTSFKLYSGSNDLDIMNQIIDGRIYPPSYFRDEIPARAEQIIMKALQKDRKKRYQTAQEMQMDIDDFLAQNEFTPSNMHLANFLKQQFKNELADEQERRRMDTPTGAKVPGNPPPPPSISAVTSHSTPSNQRLARQLTPSTADLQLTVASDTLERLERLATKRRLSREEVLRDIVEHYLKYH